MSEVASGVGLQKLPKEVDAGSDVTTLVELFRCAVSRERNLLNYKKDGHWRRVSSRELESQVRAVAMGLHALDVKVGDRVLFGKYSGQSVKVEGEELLVMREEDIMGVIE